MTERGNHPMATNDYVFWGANVFDNGWLRIEPCYLVKGNSREYYFRVENRETGKTTYSKANENQTKRIENWIKGRSAA